MRENNAHTLYLLQALELAKLHRGFCAPNPAVGAVVTLNDKVLATGYHFAPGLPHAEIDALQKLNNKAVGATIYITLEPCCHWGKTPPCTDALIQSGIKRVVYGYRDPNPLVSDKSAALLQAKGILCEHIALPEINKFYESYQYWHHKKMPFVTAKIALSLDGKIAGKSGERIPITGQELQKFTHTARKTTDAILTTVKTIICDHPKFNARDTNQIIAKPLYVLDSKLQFSSTMSVFKTAQSLTVFYAEDTQNQLQKLTDLGVRCIQLDKNIQGLDLNQVIKAIGQEGIHDVWVEAGGKCFSALVMQKLVQRALIYIAPRWIGDGQAAFADDFSLNLEGCKIHWQQLGNDALCDIHW
ncbi:MAG: ribD [Gammaproteobacteria bacterium]|jgi:diaminohydroxyphosphoribosylaminopyrimidine deaminase/5-amino-6-(5-phosphoribosylamino)uracil reductase|nr:ribD [Gammaproteobacteria bacterium]